MDDNQHPSVDLHKLRSQVRERINRSTTPVEDTESTAVDVYPDALLASMPRTVELVEWVEREMCRTGQSCYDDLRKFMGHFVFPLTTPAQYMGQQVIYDKRWNANVATVLRWLISRRLDEIHDLWIPHDLSVPGPCCLVCVLPQRSGTWRYDPLTAICDGSGLALNLRFFVSYDNGRRVLLCYPFFSGLASIHLTMQPSDLFCV